MIRKTPIEFIHDDAFEALPNLKWFDIGESNLSDPPALHLICSSLLQLYLMQNRIYVIDDDYFMGCSNLMILYISETKISSVPKLDSICNALFDLQLHRNAIIDIHNLYNTTFPKLRILNLKENRIIHLHANLMLLPAATHIVLAKNNLTEFPNIIKSKWGSKLPINNMCAVEIARGNLWHCDKEILQLLDTMDGNITSFRWKILDLERMTCHTPSSLAGMTVTQAGKYSVHFVWYGC